MATELNSPAVESFTEFTKLIEERLAVSEGPLWHRGCADFDNHHLSPGLYRHPEKTNIKELLALEMRMLTYFRLRSIPFVDRPLDEPWEQLFFMQHHAIPTRLLDWTENPFIGLYFALTSKSKTADGDSAVWMLDSVAWNRESLDRVSFKGEILSVGDTWLEFLKPGAEYETMNADPLAIYGFHNSARIVAQRGVFTIFGQDTHSMEEIYKTKDYPQNCLLKVRLPRNKKADLLRSLFRMGLTHSVIFPDLDGLAKETREFFEFGDYRV
jgi:hypothetical protein